MIEKILAYFGYCKIVKSGEFVPHIYIHKDAHIEGVEIIGANVLVTADVAGEKFNDLFEYLTNGAGISFRNASIIGCHIQSAEQYSKNAMEKCLRSARTGSA